MTGAKRAGWAGLSVLVLLAALAVQIVGTMVAVFFYAIAKGVRAGMQAAAQGMELDANEISAELMNNMSDITGAALIVVGILLLIVFIP